MPKFLSQVAKHLYDKHQHSIADLTLVFPGKRAGLYFKYYLSQIIDKPVFSPRIITMDELFREISGMQQMDSFELVVEAYNIYKQVYSLPESFDDFYFWGETMVRDFDEIDKYLVDAAKLFKNVEAIKNIDDVNDYLTDNQIKAIQQFWGTFKNEQSDAKQDFVKIWGVLGKIYTELTKSLLTKGQAYQGLIYRTVFEKVSGGNALLSIKNKHVFIGFNALNECEKRVLKLLKNTEKALFYWDYQQEFIEDAEHEAGRFIRENLKLFPQAESFVKEEEHQVKKDIHLYNVASDTAQTSVAAGILNESDNVNQHDSSAIVLADESLLKPMLYSIPEHIGGLNVTMGFPFKQTQLFVFVKLLFELQQSKILRREKELYYTPNVLNILRSTYVFGINDKNALIDRIIESNRTYIDLSYETEKSVGVNIFEVTNTPEEFLSFLQKVTNVILAQLRMQPEANQNIKIELEFAFYLKSLLNRLDNLIAQHGEVVSSLKMLYRLFLKISSNYQVSFIGEPLHGLQLMGLLETRALDFNKLILLSVNEGVLPFASSPVSFVPYTLRKGFNMPVMEQQQSIFAYYFYRLISNAQEIHLLYQSVSDGLKTAEPSRYILQLKYLAEHNIIEHYPKANVSVSESKPIAVVKAEEHMSKLLEYFNDGEKAFSPSALNTYIDCSLKFYYKYIASIKEPDEYSEEMDALDFGNVFHYAAEQVYKPFENKILNKGDIDNLLTNDALLEKYVLNAFSKEYFGGDQITKEDITGENLIVFNIIKKYLHQLLLNDIKLCPFEIISLEGEYKKLLPVKAEGKQVNVRLKGKIDRLDRVQGTYRVIDYKTGKVKKSISEIADVFDASKAIDRNSAVFQALLYCYLLPDEKSINSTPSLYFLRDFFNKGFDGQVKEGKNVLTSFNEVKDDYLELLSEKISELFDKEKKFEQTDALKMCENCAYKSLCNR